MYLSHFKTKETQNRCFTPVPDMAKKFRYKWYARGVTIDLGGIPPQVDFLYYYLYWKCLNGTWYLVYC